MPATEIVTRSLGHHSGRELLEPTGDTGRQFNSPHDWIAERRRSGIIVRDVTSAVLVVGSKKWAAYEEDVGNDTLRTVFDIT